MIVSASSEAQPAAAAAGSPAQAGVSDGTGAAGRRGSLDAAPLSALRTKGLLSCSSCGLVLLHGEHTPRLLPSCLHTVCGSCAVQQSGPGEYRRRQRGRGRGGRAGGRVNVHSLARVVLRMVWGRGGGLECARTRSSPPGGNELLVRLGCEYEDTMLAWNVLCCLGLALSVLLLMSLKMFV